MYGTSLLTLLLALSLVASGTSPLSHDPHQVMQEATPAVTFPVTPNPADCTVKPRAGEPLLALLGTPPAAQGPISGTPASERAVIEVPVGQPANGEVEASITATVYELQACFNAGDSLRAFALVTDAFLRDFVEEGALTAQDIAFLTSEPQPVPPEFHSVLVAITDVSILPDGRAGAFVVTNDAFAGPDTVYMIFVQQGERWLIDEIIEFLER